MSSRFNRRSSSPVLSLLSLLTAAILLAGTPVMVAAAEPTARSHGDYSFSIEQQPLVAALNAFTAVTGWQVGLPAELGQGVSSPGVRGALSPEKALERLLVGTNLSYRKLGNNSIALEKRAASSALNLQQLTISATRNEQDVNSVPNTVSVHEREALDRQTSTPSASWCATNPASRSVAPAPGPAMRATTFAVSTATASSPRSMAWKCRTTSSTVPMPRPVATMSTRKSSSAWKSCAVRRQPCMAAAPSAGR